MGLTSFNRIRRKAAQSRQEQTQNPVPAQEEKPAEPAEEPKKEEKPQQKKSKEKVKDETPKADASEAPKEDLF